MYILRSISLGRVNKYIYIYQAKGRRRTLKFKHSCSTPRLSLSFFRPFIILIFIKLSVIPVTVRLILIKLMTATQLNYDQRLYRNPISIVLILSNQLRDVSPPRLISTIRAKFTKLLNNKGSFALRNVSDGKEHVWFWGSGNSFVTRSTFTVLLCSGSVNSVNMIKGIIGTKMNIYSCSHVLPNPYDFLSSHTKGEV